MFKRIIFLLFILFSFRVKSAPIEEANGVFDLRKVDFSQNYQITLDSKWEFHWKTFCLPDNVSTDSSGNTNFIKCNKNKDFAYISSQFWNGSIIDGVEIEGLGYASYQLKLILPQNKKNLAIKFPPINSSFCAYLDKEQIHCSGKPGTRSETTRPGNRNHLAIIPLPASFYKKKDTFLTIHIANFQNSRGGFNQELILGDYEILKNEYHEYMVATSFIIGCLLFITLYHIAMLFLLKKISILYLIIFCFQTIAYVLCRNETFWHKIFPSTEYELVIRVEYFSQYTVIGVFFLFFHSLFEKEFSKYIYYSVLYSAFFLGLLVLFTPSYIFTNTLNIFFIIVYVAIIQSLIVVLKAIKNKKQDSKTTLLGFIIFFAFILNDILLTYKIIKSVFLVHYGALILLFFQSYLLILRFSEAFKNVEKLSIELQELNKNLEIKVEQRTKELSKEKEIAENINQLKDKFISLLVHDIRSPLAGLLYLVKSFSSKEKNLQDTQKVKEIFSEQNQIINNILKMTKEILEYNRFRMGTISINYDSISLLEVTNTVLDNLIPFLKSKNIKISHSLTEELVVVTDRVLLQEAIVNVVSNAIQYSPPNTEIKILYEIQNQTVLLKILDEGNGIPQDIQDKLFNFQYQKRKDVEGTGLGLPLTAEIISLLDGNIEINSRDQKGTVVTLSLPFEEKILVFLGDKKELKDSEFYNYRILCFQDTKSILSFLEKISPDLIVINNKNKDSKTLLADIKSQSEFTSLPIRFVSL
ncbi:MAG: sensor histidine kinase [Leptospiraceae bacterium]|nr:sensor histidine kinase [Leptospiraceae bacterium]MCP5499944.1 sensor histidine kinase [Leptospiraceae bacterium]